MSTLTTARVVSQLRVWLTHDMPLLDGLPCGLSVNSSYLCVRGVPGGRVFTCPVASWCGNMPQLRSLLDTAVSPEDWLATLYRVLEAQVGLTGTLMLVIHQFDLLRSCNHIASYSRTLLSHLGPAGGATANTRLAYEVVMTDNAWPVPSFKLVVHQRGFEIHADALPRCVDTFFFDHGRYMQPPGTYKMVTRDPEHTVELLHAFWDADPEMMCEMRLLDRVWTPPESFRVCSTAAFRIRYLKRVVLSHLCDPTLPCRSCGTGSAALLALLRTRAMCAVEPGSLRVSAPLLGRVIMFL